MNLTEQQKEEYEWLTNNFLSRMFLLALTPHNKYVEKAVNEEHTELKRFEEKYNVKGDNQWNWKTL